jgi:hypothetical protein
MYYLMVDNLARRMLVSTNKSRKPLRARKRQIAIKSKMS